MATLNKKNETVVAPFYKNGVTLQFLEIDFGANVSAKLDTDYVNYSGAAARSPVAVVLEAIAKTVTIEVIGTVQADSSANAGQLLRIAVAAPGGAYPAQTYDGTNSESLATFLTSEIVGLGTVQGVNLASAAVADYTF
jgi:hypothetical protein